MNIGIPTITEQTKIANFLSAIDEKIGHSLQIEKVEQRTDFYKRCLCK